MPANAVETANRLVASLEAALEVFEIQGQQIEAAKRRCEGSTTALQQMLAAGLAGKSADPAVREEFEAQQQARLAQWSGENVKESIRSSAQLSLRWETAFCDMFDALMHLYAFPMWSDAADRLAGQVRRLRLLQVADAEEIPEPLPFSTVSADPTSTESGQPVMEEAASPTSGLGFNKFEYAQQFMARIEVHRQKVQEGFANKTKLTQDYLTFALEDARKLAEAVARQ